MKKLLLLFALGFCSLVAWADGETFTVEAPAGQFLNYQITGSNSVSIVSVSQASGDLEIPSTVTHNGVTYTVKRIVYNAFYLCDNITSITIPNTVTKLDEGAFERCPDLASIIIGNSVDSIKQYTFYRCTALTSIVIGSSVSYIDKTAFGYCNTLANISVASENTTFDSRDNCNAIIETATNMLVYGFKNSTIPNSVTKIKSKAFEGRVGPTTVNCGSSLQSIGSEAFKGCTSLTTLNISSSVTSIDNTAFQECSSLRNITVASGNTTYDSRNNCNAIINTSNNKLVLGCKNTAIPNLITSIGDNAFYNIGCPENLVIPNSVTSIGAYAFRGCGSLKSVVIGRSVTSIGSQAFFLCQNLKTVYNLTNITFEKGQISNGYVACYAYRIVNSVSNGNNSICQIPVNFTVVDNEDQITSHIPYATIPANFVYLDNGEYKAKEVVLTDCQDKFFSPFIFTAEKATYTRDFASGNRSTLYLPFAASVPTGLEVYDFSDFDNNTITFTEHTGNIAAYTPYLVGYDLSKDGSTQTCTITQTNAMFPQSHSSNYHPVTHDEMTFCGVIERTTMSSTNNYGYSDGYFVQSGGSAHVNPFRCYFTYNPPAGAPQGLPPTLGIDFSDNSPMGIYDVEKPQNNIRYSNDVYDTMGRLIRRNADNLNGLPKGIYIWRGKKVLVFQH